MSATKRVSVSSYRDVIEHGHDITVLFFREYGSYQGDWIAFAKNDQYYFVYKDSYGSCSGCDALQSESDDASWEERKDGNWTLEHAREFAKGYKPFIEIPRETAINLVQSGEFGKVMPRNVREHFDGYDDEAKWENVQKDLELIVKLEEGIDIAAEDIMLVKDMELQQRILKKYGYEKFADELGATELHRDEFGVLVAVGEIKFVKVKDASTSREYLLRVPPNIERAKQGVAWTFGLKEEEYSLVKQT